MRRTLENSLLPWRWNILRLIHWTINPMKQFKGKRFLNQGQTLPTLRAQKTQTLWWKDRIWWDCAKIQQIILLWRVQGENKIQIQQACSQKYSYWVTDKTFTCDKCGFETRWREALNRHMLMEAGVKQSCNECDYQAFDKRNLRKHIVTGFRYTCDQCDYSCKIQKSLVKHKNGIHHAKISKCGQCNYTTISKGNLKHHIDENHSGLGYPCDICEHLYRSHNAVKYHMQKKHPEESYDNISKVWVHIVSCIISQV